MLAPLAFLPRNPSASGYSQAVWLDLAQLRSFVDEGENRTWGKDHC